MLENLHELLESGKEKGKIKEFGNHFKTFVRINSGLSNVDVVYVTQHCEDEIININSKLEFFGLYKKADKTLYVDSWRLPLGEDIIGIRNTIKIDNLKDRIVLNVRNKVKELIGDDEKNIKELDFTDEYLEKSNRYSAEESAYSLFMNDRDVNMLEYLEMYVFQVTEHFETLLIKYLNNPEQVINEEANSFIINNGKDIAFMIVNNSPFRV